MELQRWSLLLVNSLKFAHISAHFLKADGNKRWHYCLISWGGIQIKRNDEIH